MKWPDSPDGGCELVAYLRKYVLRQSIFFKKKSLILENGLPNRNVSYYQIPPEASMELLLWIDRCLRYDVLKLHVIVLYKFYISFVYQDPNTQSALNI